MRRITLGRVLAVAIALVAFVGFVLGIAAGSARDPLGASAASLEPSGRRLLRLMLDDLGFETELFERTPERLPEGRALLWSGRVPGSEQADGAAEEARAPGDPAPLVALERRRAKAYRAFVERGGTWILPAGEATESWLVERAELPELASAARVEDAPEAAREGFVLLGPNGERHPTHLTSPRFFAEPSAVGGARPLALDDEGRVFALALPLGAGELVLVADGSFLANGDALDSPAPSRGIAAQDHALLAVRLIEAVRRGGPILFDEFALGRWRPESAAALVISPALRGLALQLCLVALVGVVALAWPRAFPRDPRPLETLSPLERARARARLFLRAGHVGRLDLYLRRGALEALAQHTGRRLAPHGRGSELTDATAAELERALEPLDVRAPELAARWRAVLAGPPARDAAALDALGTELAALERALDALDADRAAPVGARGRRR